MKRLSWLLFGVMLGNVANCFGQNKSNSIKQAEILTGAEQTQEYFHLLISETGEPINETFEQIEQEFPDEVIKKIVDEIEKAIKTKFDGSLELAYLGEET